MAKYDDPQLESRYQKLLAAKRIEKRRQSKERMLPFMQLINPDPEDPEDVNRSQFEATPLARLLCQIIEKVNRGEEKRVAVSVGPQFGKSQVLARSAGMAFRSEAAAEYDPGLV